MSRSSVKTLLTVFFDYKGIVHLEYAPPGQTVSKRGYREVFRRLRDAIRRKRPKLPTSSEWQLHHDNTPANSAQLVRQCLARHSIPQVHHIPQISPIATFSTCQNSNPHLTGRRFQDIEEIKVNVTRQQLITPVNEFQKCFHQLKQRQIKGSTLKEIKCQIVTHCSFDIKFKLR
eukprot:XP_014777529.1 PREDICTED: uncharacterized protein LOC106874342 [Octopus bimaculoides]